MWIWPEMAMAGDPYGPMTGGQKTDAVGGPARPAGSLSAQCPYPDVDHAGPVPDVTMLAGPGSNSSGQMGDHREPAAETAASPRPDRKHPAGLRSAADSDVRDLHTAYPGRGEAPAGGTAGAARPAAHLDLVADRPGPAACRAAIAAAAGGPVLPRGTGGHALRTADRRGLPRRTAVRARLEGSRYRADREGQAVQAGHDAHADPQPLALAHRYWWCHDIKLGIGRCP